MINCFPLFDIEILSQSLLNQYDQLALKFLPSLSNGDIKDEYKLILYAVDHGLDGSGLINSINMSIKIEKIVNKPEFDLSEYEFVIRLRSILKYGTILGSVKAQSNDKTKRIVYKLLNKTINFVEINSLTGHLFISNEDFLKENPFFDQVEFFVEASYLINKNSLGNLKSFTKVKIYFRSMNYLKNISFQFDIRSKFIRQLNDSKTFFIKENIPQNEILFQFHILSFYYPFDQYLLSIQNYQSIFSLVSLSRNHFTLKLNYFPLSKSIYLLNIGIKHQLTAEYLSNFTFQFIGVDRLLTSSSSRSNFIRESLSLSSSNICLENSTYFLYDLNNETEIGRLKVVQSNFNISFFSNFLILINETEFLIDQCRMFIDQFDYSYLNQSLFQLCSSNEFCFNISLNNQLVPLLSNENTKSLISKWILPLQPVEIVMFSLSLVFILATITLILIICRLKGFRLCLKIKNYLFYGKKYGLNNGQHLSSVKMTVSYSITR